VPEFQFDGMQDFLAMGGYAFYVWISYLFFALVVAWNLIQPRIERRKLLLLHKARMQREAGLNKQRVTEQS
jgi:heme exporter protein D